MKNIKTEVQNISNGPVTLRTKEGKPFVLNSGQTTDDFRKDSRFIGARKNRIVRLVDVEVEEDVDKKENTEDKVQTFEGIEIDFNESLEDEVKENKETFELDGALAVLPDSVQTALVKHGYYKVEDIEEATDEEILSIDGIGESYLTDIKEAIGLLDKADEEKVSDEGESIQ